MLSPSFENPPSAVGFLAHHLKYAFALMIALRVAGYVAGPGSFLPHLTDPIYVALLLASIFAVIAHQRDTSLCLRCITAMPLDPQERAQRYTRLLWLQHVINRKTALKIAAAFGVATALFWLLGIPPVILDVPADLYMFTVLAASDFHHRYQSWCPYCRNWGDGGAHEPSPDPMNVGTHTPH